MVVTVIVTLTDVKEKNVCDSPKLAGQDNVFHEIFSEVGFRLKAN